MALTQVSTGGIKDATVATADIAADAVTGAKIADDAVGAEHIEVLDSHLQLTDNSNIKLGTGDDLLIYHNGSDSYVKNSTGDLYIRDTNGNIYIQPKTDENGIKCIADGATEIYHDNSKTAYTHSSGFNIKGGNTSDQTELQIYGNEGQDASILLTSDDGDDNADNWRMYAQASDHSFALKNYAAGAYENSIVAHGNGAVELYHDNSKKLETTSSGTTTTGDGYLTGRLLVGTTTAGESNGDEATFYNNGNAGITIRSAVDSECKIYFSEGTSGGSQYRGAINYNHNHDHMGFNSNEHERFRIDSSGNKILDNTFDVNSTSSRRSYFTSTGQQIHSRNEHESYIVFTKLDQTTVGSITRGTTTTAYNTTSDYRLKENVTGISDGITRLKSLKPSRFNFKADAKTTVDGFLAHEVSSIVPEAIEGEKDALITQAMLDSGALQGKVGDPLYQQIDQSKLVPLLTAALQEAIAKIETLETKVAALEAA